MSFFTKGPLENPLPFWQNGPAPGAYHAFPGTSTARQHDSAITRSKGPITTGATVLGLKFKDGIVIAADTLGSYGSMARFRNIDRVIKVNDNIVMAAGGDYADFQYLKSAIEQKVLDEECLDDGFMLKPKALHCWLTHVMYSKRSKFDPLWNELLIAGFDNDQPFLGFVDKLGTAFTNHVIATGFGAYLAAPLLEEEYAKNPEMTKEEALKSIHKAMELLTYRDCRAFPKYSVGIVTKESGIEITGPIEVSGFWDAAKLVTE